MKQRIFTQSSLISLFLFFPSTKVINPAVYPPTSPLISQTNSSTLKSGTFVNGEHETKGTVKIIQAQGKRYLELGQDFRTSEMGPDLVVILHRSNNVIGTTKPPAYPLNAKDYVIIAPLKNFQGLQRYEIGNNLNLAEYQSVGIWCRRFNATFGAATLK